MLKSKTILGVIVTVIGFLTQPDVLALLPYKWGVVITSIGAIITAWGLRSAIDKAGSGAAPTRSVTQ